MRIIVTGGAGFIGSMLCKHLVKRGDDVIVLDNLSNGRRELVEALGPGVRLLEVDIRDSEAVRGIVKDTRPQGICHLAAIHFIPYCNEHPLEALDINVQGTLSVLEACKATPPEMVVIASTAAVYGIGMSHVWRQILQNRWIFTGYPNTRVKSWLGSIMPILRRRASQ